MTAPSSTRSPVEIIPALLGDRFTGPIVSGAFANVLHYDHKPAPTTAAPDDRAVRRLYADERIAARQADPVMAVAAEVSRLGAFTGFAIGCAGFNVNNGAGVGIPSGAIRIDWRLFLALDCAVDDDPVFEGSTFLADITEKRQGLLVQVSNILATGAILQAQATDAAGGRFGLTATFSVRLIEGSMGGTAAQVLAGPVIG